MGRLSIVSVACLAALVAGGSAADGVEGANRQLQQDGWSAPNPSVHEGSIEAAVEPSYPNSIPATAETYNEQYMSTYTPQDHVPGQHQGYQQPPQYPPAMHIQQFQPEVNQQQPHYPYPPYVPGQMQTQQQQQQQQQQYHYQPTYPQGTMPGYPSHVAPQVYPAPSPPVYAPVQAAPSHTPAAPHVGVPVPSHHPPMDFDDIIEYLHTNPAHEEAGNAVEPTEEAVEEEATYAVDGAYSASQIKTLTDQDSVTSIQLSPSGLMWSSSGPSFIDEHYGLDGILAEIAAEARAKRSQSHPSEVEQIPVDEDVADDEVDVEVDQGENSVTENNVAEVEQEVEQLVEEVVDEEISGEEVQEIDEGVAQENVEAVVQEEPENVMPGGVIPNVAAQQQLAAAVPDSTIVGR